jgi:hypothetical protein
LTAPTRRSAFVHEEVPTCTGGADARWEARTAAHGRRRRGGNPRRRLRREGHRATRRAAPRAPAGRAFDTRRRTSARALREYARPQAARRAAPTPAELVLEPDRTEEPERIVAEHVVRNGPDDPRLEIGASSVRISRLAAVERKCDRVEREVARREVRVDAVGQRREVDRPFRARRRDAPRSVALGQWKRCSTETSREPVSGSLRIGARDIEVDDGPTEQLIAHRSTDHPRLLADEDLDDALIHRVRPVAHGRRR